VVSWNGDGAPFSRRGRTAPAEKGRQKCSGGRRPPEPGSHGGLREQQPVHADSPSDALRVTSASGDLPLRSEGGAFGLETIPGVVTDATPDAVIDGCSVPPCRTMFDPRLATFSQTLAGRPRRGVRFRHRRRRPAAPPGQRGVGRGRAAAGVAGLPGTVIGLAFPSVPSRRDASRRHTTIPGSQAASI